MRVARIMDPAKHRGDVKPPQAKRGLKALLAAAAAVVAVIVAANWSALTFVILARPATRSDLLQLRRASSDANPLAGSDSYDPRQSGYLHRWWSAPTPVGVWTTWYGETQLPRTRTRLSLRGDFLGETHWLPSGEIQYQLDESGELVTEPPWIHGEGRLTRTTDIRNVRLGPAGLETVSLRHWEATKLRANHSVLESIDFSFSRFKGAEFEGAQLAFVSFTKARLGDTSFARADLKECRFGEVEATSSDFTESRVRECDFSNAILRATVWDSASITDTSFEGADFLDATFKRATLRNVDLRRARNLTRDQLTDANLDESVLLPAF